MNQAELQLHADQKKTELYAQKELLFFAIDEKSHEADLSEKGRTFLSPQDPDAFMLPDLTTALHEIDVGPETDARKRLEAKTKLQQVFEAKSPAYSRHFSVAQGILPVRKGRAVRRPGEQSHHRR